MILMLGVGAIIELLTVHISLLWKIKLISASLVTVSIGMYTGYSVANGLTSIGLLLLLLNTFRLFNVIKFARPNIHPHYLRSVTKRSSNIFSIILFGLLILQNSNIILGVATISVWAILLFCISLATLAITAKNLQKTQHHKSNHYFSDKELPTVTVAIPARNETDDLASCIRTILANDYPKLEILVYDDCSYDRTAEIIRDFAHDGVRFISGLPPEDRWLAKNKAYDTLYDNASGEIVLFCGVDVRLGPVAIRSLVSSMLTKNKLMMSVMPIRIGGGMQTSLIQPLRYWWELALPRKTFNRPPVLSTCWIIERKALKKLGGFEGVRHNILPERYFARELVKTDKYSFIRADEHLDIKTVKSAEEQLNTAIRVKYPSLRKRPENVLLLIVIEATVLFAPLVFTLSLATNGLTLTGILGGLSLFSFVAVHYLIMSASHPFHSTLALFNYPFAVATEIILTIYSLYKYEFGTVNWKGRNVCIPTMHVIKKLPKI